MTVPLESLTRATTGGRAVLVDAGLPLEPEGVAFAVEAHRWAWRPERVRVVLIAESHVFTSDADIRCRVHPKSLPPEARRAPTEFVRLVYCLGYGESTVMAAPPDGRNSGTPQFWNIFGRLAGTGRQPTTLRATWRERIRWKVDTLLALQQRGVWLLDASLHGVYAPGGARVSADVTRRLHEVWWEHYGHEVLVGCGNAYRCVIGRGVSNTLHDIGVPFDGWIYQPQARAADGVDLERGWDALLAAVNP